MADGLLTIIIVNYETSGMVHRCVESLNGQDYPHEIIVVDNPSPAQDFFNLKLPTEVTLVRNQENVGYGQGCNAGAMLAAAESRYICILNPDTAMPAHGLRAWMDVYRELCEKTDAVGVGAAGGGMVGPRLVNDNGAVQRSAYRFPGFVSYWVNHSLLAGLLKGWRKGTLLGGTGQSPRPAFEPGADASASSGGQNPDVSDLNHTSDSLPRKTDWLMGAALLMNRGTWEKVNGFSPDYFLYAEDTDLAWRIRQAGYPIWYAPQATVIHTQGDPSSDVRDRAIVRLFDGLKTFVEQHYGFCKRAEVKLAVIIDMLMRLPLLATLLLLKPNSALHRSRLKGYWQVLRRYLS